MTRISYQRAKLHELRAGQTAEFYAMLVEKTARKTKSQSPFFHLVFRDSKRRTPAKVWSDSVFYPECEQSWQVNNYFKLVAKYEIEDRFGTQLALLEVHPASSDDYMDGFDPNDFEPHSRFDSETMFAELLGYAEKITDRPLRELVQLLLNENASGIKRHPAAARYHHAYRGGYLEHTLSVVTNGAFLADRYLEYYPDLEPPLNKDLILAGCILHDIGKLYELEATPDGGAYTLPGNLIGHILIGRDMVARAADRVKGLHPHLRLFLEHIIVSHQGTKEWDSPKEPMLPEALLVHFADDVDAKFNMIVEILRGSDTAGQMTDANNIFRRKFVKTRDV